MPVNVAGVSASLPSACYKQKREQGPRFCNTRAQYLPVRLVAGITWRGKRHRAEHVSIISGILIKIEDGPKIRRLARLIARLDVEHFGLPFFVQPAFRRNVYTRTEGEKQRYCGIQIFMLLLLPRQRESLMSGVPSQVTGKLAIIRINESRGIIRQHLLFCDC
jgi:hypothetical protein